MQHLPPPWAYTLFFALPQFVLFQYATVKRYDECGRRERYQTLPQLSHFLRDVFGAQWTSTETTPTHIRVHVPLPCDEEVHLEPTQEERAWVQLWAMGKDGSSFRTTLYFNMLTAIKSH